MRKRKRIPLSRYVWFEVLPLPEFGGGGARREAGERKAAGRASGAPRTAEPGSSKEAISASDGGAGGSSASGGWGGESGGAVSQREKPGSTGQAQASPPVRQQVIDLAGGRHERQDESDDNECGEAVSDHGRILRRRNPAGAPEGSCQDPIRTIGPVGAGTPPLGSIVTAKF